LLFSLPLKKRKYANKKKVYTINDARKIVLQIKKIEGLSKHSLDNYEKVFNDFDRFWGEETDISSLTVDDVRQFIDWQLNKKLQFMNQKTKKVKKIGVSVSTINTYLTYAKAIFSVLKNEGIVEENIFQHVKKVKEHQKKIDILTIPEIKKMLRTLKKDEIYSEFRMYVLIHVLLDSFGRIGEVLSLTWNDVDFEHYCITFTNTKNKKVRTIPITKKTVKLLQELKEENDDFNSEYVFLTNHGKPLGQSAFRKHLKMIIERAGIQKRVHAHLFRHTASAMFIQQNGSVRVLQKILDHSDLSTTSRYAHVLDSTIREQHERFSPIHLLEEYKQRKMKRTKGGNQI
jgi:integrase/recombinase XerD